MALKIIWSKRAEKGFADIVLYLEKEFTEKEVRKFIQDSNHFFELLKKNLKCFKKQKHTQTFTEAL